MKIKITVDIENTDGTFAAEATMIEVEVPDFEAFTGPDKFGAVFNEYERNVIKARNDAIAAATEKYLNEMAKKKTQSRALEIQGRVVERPKTYGIDAEIGRLRIAVCEIRSGSQKVFRADKDIFPETGSREQYQTPCFKELVVFFPCDESFRKSTQKINRVLWRGEEDAIQYRTIANIVEREGDLIQEHICKKAEDILKSHGFSAEGKVLDDSEESRSVIDNGSIVESFNCKMPEDLNRGKELQSAEGKLLDDSEGDRNVINTISITEDLISKMIEDLNVGKDKELQIELADLQETFEDQRSIKANISLDDVLSKKQKEVDREKGSPAKKKKEFVKNTVAHIQSGENDIYVLNAASLKQMMIIVLAFLLKNGLFSRAGQLIFFIDGAADLHLAIHNLFFGLLSFKIVLDWHHLEKKCKKRLSVGMKGKQAKNKALEHILALLWRGKIDLAITYLRGLNADDLKNPEEIELLIGYFERNRSFMPCYALRQKLGLRVSSNRVEKANDLVVSTRQKHNGMSWSASGSNSLATITSIHLNNEDSHWLVNHEIKFQFSKPAEKTAA